MPEDQSWARNLRELHLLAWCTAGHRRRLCQKFTEAMAKSIREDRTVRFA